MTKLGVNIDHIATIRQARQALEPDPVAAAILAELAGADGVTVHLRGDRRHIQDDDVRRLRETVTTRLNLEMAATTEMVRAALKLHPDQATLVPEKKSEITTEGGLNVAGNPAPIAAAIKDLTRGGIQVSLFIDPDPKQIDASANLGAVMIELCTRAYAETTPRSPDLAGGPCARESTRVVQAAERGKQKGLRVLAGHGLTYRNVRIISDIPEIEELNIGHSIIARAALVGMDRAVREMLKAMSAQD
jgi:pyridoxine 5-phosphate synthase